MSLEKLTVEEFCLQNTINPRFKQNLVENQAGLMVYQGSLPDNHSMVFCLEKPTNSGSVNQYAIVKKEPTNPARNIGYLVLDGLGSTVAAYIYCRGNRIDICDVDSNGGIKVGGRVIGNQVRALSNRAKIKIESYTLEFYDNPSSLKERVEWITSSQ